jgi:glycosyltransferase involved in cell wall biosynthesis
MSIGYLMQNGAPDLDITSGPQLHTLAVITGFQKLGYSVRTVAIQKNRLIWADDLNIWHKPKFGFTQSRGFRIVESILRRIQTELHLPFLGLFDSLHYADACTRLLKDYHFLYERHGYLGYGGVLASRWMRIPLILELNGNIVQEIDEIGVRMSKLQRWVGRWITLHTWLAATHLVVVSEALKSQLVNLGIPETKVSVVMNGVNVEIFSKKYDQNSARNFYQIGCGPIIVFVGSFQPWHGVELLVSSFLRVLKEFPNATLLLIGDGEGRGRVEQKIIEFDLSDKVKITGRLEQEKIAELLFSSDVAVAPYPLLHGNIVGTPLKLLEYMAAGKAIVASTAPIHEIISDGVNGIRVPPANDEALADGIIRLLSDAELRKTLGTNAQSLAVEKYSWDKTVHQIVNIFMTRIPS